MVLAKYFLGTVLLTLVTVAFAVETPKRAAGVSMHFLPKRVAEIGGKRWGLTVDYRPYLKPESAPPVLQSANEVIAFVEKQD